MIIKNFKHLQNYIEKNYLFVLREGVEAFLQRNADSIDELQDDRIHSYDTELQGLKLLDCFPQIQGNGDFLVVCKVGIGVELAGCSNEETEWDFTVRVPKTANLRVTLKAEFDETMTNIEVVKITVMKKGERFVPCSLDSKRFLPSWSATAIDKVAEEFLLQFYPQALAAPTRLPVMDVLRAMGLNVRAGNLEKGKFGKCYFADGINIRANGTQERIPRKTVLYREAKSVRARKVMNFTLMHEGSHWYCNKGYFARMSIIDPSLVYANFTDSVYTGDYAEDFRIMEWQANSLAARVLMPAEMTRRKFQSLASEIRARGVENSIKVWEEAMKELADFFDVSLQTAKIRLLEIGFSGLKGIFDYVDGGYTRPYLYDSRKTKKNETYSIGQMDFIKLAYENEQVKELLQTRKFLYVEKFFVRNDSRFVKKKPNGELTLTEFALFNMDMCCLAFRCEKDETTQQETYSCCLSREKTPDSRKRFDYSNENNFSLIDMEVDPCIEVEEMQEALSLVLQLNGRVGDDIAKLLQIHQCSERAAERLTGLNHNRIGSIKRNEGKTATKREILALCAGLELHPRVSHHLLQKIGCNITTSFEPEDLCYEYLINAFFDKGRDAWNDFLAEANRHDWQIPYRIA